MSAQAEQWRVSTIEGIFETDLETLKQWIVEGCVTPTDKVSKGKLSWIEAGRAPMLRAAFNGEISNVTPPPTVTVTEQTPPLAVSDVAEADHPPQIFEPEESATHSFSPPRLGNACHNHPEVSPKFVCRVCAAPLCTECPRYVGTTNIPICPLCGDMCKPYEEVRSRVERLDFQSSGFGFQDFGRALRYPLQHKVALLFGAAVYGFLQLGGLRGRVVAFVIMFGCISHVISQVAWGKLNRSFLPDFSAFSLWDDLACPIGLGIGITIVTWGPAIVFGLALVFGLINGPSLSPLDNSAFTQQKPTGGLTPEDLSALTNPEADPKKLAEANEKLNATRPGSIISKEAEKSQKELNDPTADLRMLMNYLRLPMGLVLLLLLSIVWGIFMVRWRCASRAIRNNSAQWLIPSWGWIRSDGWVVLISKPLAWCWWFRWSALSSASSSQ